MNFSHIYPLFMCISTNKTLTHIELECVQLHNLSDTPFYGLAGAKAKSDFGETPLNFNPDATFSDGSEVYTSDFLLDGCPISSYPEQPVGDWDTPDYCVNYVGEDVVNASNTFIASSLDDPILLEGGDFYNYIVNLAESIGWNNLTTPSSDLDNENFSARIFLATNCIWEDIIEHNVEKILVLDEDGLAAAQIHSNSNNSFEDLDLTELYIPSSLFNITNILGNYGLPNENVFIQDTTLDMSIHFTNIPFPTHGGEATVNIENFYIDFDFDITTDSFNPPPVGESYNSSAIEIIDGEWEGADGNSSNYKYNFKIEIRWRELFEQIANTNLSNFIRILIDKCYGNYFPIGFKFKVSLDNVFWDSSFNTTYDDEGNIIYDPNNLPYDSTSNYIEQDFNIKAMFGFFAPDDDGWIDSNFGDVNADGEINVLDIVALANAVLASDTSDLEDAAGDMNQDGEFNVLDIVALANAVLEGG